MATNRILIALIGLALLSGTIWFTPVLAQIDERVGEPMLPMEYSAAKSPCDVGDPTCGLMLPKESLAAADPLFATYVDFDELSRSWAELDAVAMIDVVLQLAEGERILARPRKQFSADDLFALAIRTATEKGDLAAIERLEQVAKARQDERLSDKLALVEKLGKTSRSADLMPRISVQDVDVAAFNVYRRILEEAEIARVMGDRERCDLLGAKIENHPLLSTSQKASLKESMEQTKASIPADGTPNRAAMSLEKLAGPSRCDMSDPTCGMPFARLQGVSRTGEPCDASDPTCGMPFARLQGVSRTGETCDMGDPDCGLVLPFARLQGVSRAGEPCNATDPTCGMPFVRLQGVSRTGAPCDASDPTCGMPFARLQGVSRTGEPCSMGDPDCGFVLLQGVSRTCDASDPGCGMPFARLQGVSRTCDASDPTCGWPLAGNARSIGLPTDASDPAFNQYVDIGLLIQAWQTKDPALLTDAALQLAEGERVLLRPHKMISADKLLSVAFRAASVKKHQATLERLSMFVEENGSYALKKEIAIAEKLGGDSRVFSQHATVSVHETSPSAYAMYHYLFNQVLNAKIGSDASALERLGKEIESASQLSELQRAHLLTLLKTAQAETSEGVSTDAGVEALNKLGSVRRGWVVDLTGYSSSAGFEPKDRLHP